MAENQRLTNKDIKEKSERTGTVVGSVAGGAAGIGASHRIRKLHEPADKTKAFKLYDKAESIARKRGYAPSSPKAKRLDGAANKMVQKIKNKTHGKAALGGAAAAVAHGVVGGKLAAKAHEIKMRADRDKRTNG